MSGYKGTRLSDTISIKSLYTVHYFEYAKEFSFIGEKHNFWELVYADKGEITVTADDKNIVLSQGEIIFHKPNQWHNVSANRVDAPNIAIISFASDSKAMNFFEDRILRLNQEQKLLISNIINEYTNAFSTTLADPYTTKLTRRHDQSFGAEQLIKMHLCELLISLIRGSTGTQQQMQLSLNREKNTLEELVKYMEEHIFENISLSQLINFSGTNRTTIESLFNTTYKRGAIEHFIYMKIELAKEYLRFSDLNITQIAEKLGYSGIHYFSRQFKKVTGMTPTEYSSSIKAMTDFKQNKQKF